ncbi:MAG: hypothetical protein ACLSVX_13370 [Massilimicrobiota timonensis]
MPVEELKYLKSTMPELGLEFFYTIHDPGIILPLFIITVAMIPNIISIDFLKYKQNKFKYLLVNRISYKKLKKFFRYVNFIYSFIFAFISQIVVLIVIHLFCFEISFDTSTFYNLSEQVTKFSNSVLLNLIVYIFLSSFGYAIFSHFIYSLQTVVKNTYLYKSLGIFISLILIIGPGVLTNVTHGICGNLIATLSYFLCVTNLLNPGTIITPILDESMYIFFYIGAIIIYYLMAFYFFEIGEKREYQYDK